MIIYKVTNKVNGKIYIGQTRRSLEARKQQHFRVAKKNGKTHLCKAIRKYGENNFIFEVICHTDNKETLNELEKFYINKYDSITKGYNMVVGGRNNIMDDADVKERHKQRMQSPETRKKISDTMKKVRAEKGFSEETRRKISEKLKGNHNFGTGDTRSLAVYCIDDKGIRHDFHSIKEAGVWWYENYKPFPYSVCVYQRKIQQSIKLGYSTFQSKSSKDYKIVDNIKWYYEGGDVNEKVSN